MTGNIICYFGSWANYRPGNGKFFVENINPHLCTHIVYTFVGLSDNGDVRILDPNNDIDNGGYKKLIALKQKNPKLKTLVAIGGWNEGSARYSQVVSKPATRSALAKNMVAFAKRYKFDGFDIDWEYPAKRGGAASDKENYISLLKELRARFDDEGLILTAAVAAPKSYQDASYNVPKMSRYLDFINIMAYDLHGSWDNRAGMNAPLYPSSKDTTDAAKQLNIKAVVKGWLDGGAKASKLVLGIPLYGRSYTLANPSNNGVYAPTSGPGKAGPYTREPGMLGYNEICEMQSSWKQVWDDEQKVPYMFRDNQWVSFDNAKSVTLKAEFAKKMGLGGVMVWSIETDDFHGHCGQGKFPILRAINSVFK